MDDFDIGLSPGEEDLQDQARRMKEYRAKFKMWKSAQNFNSRMSMKADKVKAKQEINKMKAKNKPVLKFISTVGMLIFCMKFMQDHHTDKLSKEDYKYMETIGKQLGFSNQEINKIVNSASDKVKAKSNNNSSSSGTPPYWNM